jgi:hypothetical protein
VNAALLRRTHSRRQVRAGIPQVSPRRGSVLLIEIKEFIPDLYENFYDYIGRRSLIFKITPCEIPLKLE